METLIFAANIMYAIAYFTTDMLRLRALTVTAAACLTAYFYAQPEPFWSVVGWNLFFISLNLYQIGRLIGARKKRGEGRLRAAKFAAGAEA